ncbi:tyrosine transaminase family protein [Striga asiatica]|uniref:Tyrosine transaminase family protein n=1 Tax=Striga asiatica TaxID=4170 RepID=A0A5A7RC97_STRAF|nr:tyrosine transaminase family protein [Striga asiatica]
MGNRQKTTSCSESPILRASLSEFKSSPQEGIPTIRDDDFNAASASSLIQTIAIAYETPPNPVCDTKRYDPAELLRETLKTKAVSLEADTMFTANVSKSDPFGAFPSVIGTRAYLMGKPSASKHWNTSRGVCTESNVTCSQASDIWPPSFSWMTIIAPSYRSASRKISSLSLASIRSSLILCQNTGRPPFELPILWMTNRIPSTVGIATPYTGNPAYSIPVNVPATFFINTINKDIECDEPRKVKVQAIALPKNIKFLADIIFRR